MVIWFTKQHDNDQVGCNNEWPILNDKKYIFNRSRHFTTLKFEANNFFRIGRLTKYSINVSLKKKIAYFK